MATRSSSRCSPGSLAGLLAATAVVLAGCGSASKSASSASDTAASAGTPKPAGLVAISTTKGSVGTYLTADSGRAVYMWMADTGGRSKCTGACARFWPPLFTTGTPAVSGGAHARELGTITRSDGRRQLTYKGHPLYYFLEDRAAGTVHGQGNDGFGAKWWLVAPSGAAITTKSASATSGSSGAAASSSGGYGY